LSLFLPLYAVHCVEQIYFVYGNVLQGYGIEPRTIGLILGSFFVSIMATRPLGGWVLENFGIRRTLLGSSIVGFIGCSILFASKSIPLLFAGRVLSGACFGVYSIGIFSYLALVVPEKARAASFALTISGGILPIATITPFGEWLIAKSMPRAFLAIGPSLCVICWLLGRQVGPVASSRRDNSPGNWGSYRDLLSNRPFIFLMATGFMIALTDASLVSVSLFAAEHGLAASWFMASSSIAGLIVRVPCSRVMNILPSTLMLAPFGIMMTAAVFLVSFVPSVEIFVIGGVIFGLGIGAGFPLLISMVSDTLPQSLIPKGTASLLAFYDLGWFITPILIGFTTELIGTAWSFRLVSGISLAFLLPLQICYWFPFWLSKRTQRARSRV
jgi:MFS family permease